VLQAAHLTDGEDDVPWGSRGGWQTLLSTEIGQEYAQTGRFLNLRAGGTHWIGLKVSIPIYTESRERARYHQDLDCTAAHALRLRLRLDREVNPNFEIKHATLAGPSFEQELARVLAHGMFGSVDVTCGDPQAGRDKDPLRNHVAKIAWSEYALLQGGFASGGHMHTAACGMIRARWHLPGQLRRSFSDSFVEGGIEQHRTSDGPALRSRTQRGRSGSDWAAEIVIPVATLR